MIVVAIAKNEGNYIREWVNYYRLLGMDKIVIYDNESEDNLEQILCKEIQEGFVDVIPFPGKCMQCPAYNDAITRYKNRTKYMAIVDCDEFIYPMDKNLTIKDIMRKYETVCPNLGGVGLNWMVFGSSGYKEKQDGLVTETFLKRSEESHWVNRHIKTICNPRLVMDFISPHYPVYRLGAWNTDAKGNRLRLWYNRENDYSLLRVNHYYTKSFEEFVKKRNRGKADRAGLYDMKQFETYDLNDVYDDGMLMYANNLHTKLSEGMVE